MESKLNQSFINVYSQRLASEICDRHFAEHSHITGEQILSCFPVEQINLLIMQELFKNWNAEFEQLRSPYFDYQHQEVKQALRGFMNELSKHIRIQRSDFEPLAQQAVRLSILLLFSPYEFFLAELNRYERLEVNTLKNAFRFVRVNKHVVSSLLNQLESRFGGSIESEAARELLDRSFENMQEGPEDFEPHAEKLSKVLPISVEDIFIDSQESEEDWDREESHTPDIPADAEEGVRAPRPVEVESPEEVITEEWKEEDKPETKSAEPDTVPEPEETEEPIAEETEEETTEPEPQEAFEEYPEPEETQEAKDPTASNNLNDRYSSEQKATLHDKLASNKQEKTLAETHASKKVESIRKSITINQRFMFVNELFGGDTQKFNEAIEHLEQEEDYHAALKHINHHYARRHDWDMEGEEAQEFLAVVARRFQM